jgi:hypothetical protein
VRAQVYRHSGLCQHSAFSVFPFASAERAVDTMPSATTTTHKKTPATNVENRGNSAIALILGQLKFPLVFFGLALVLIESSFVSVLQRNALPVAAQLEVVRYMAGLFALSTVIVGLLVWKVPEHIMLTAQAKPPTDVIKLVRSSVRVFQLLQDWEQQEPEKKSPSSLLSHFQEALRLLQEESVVTEDTRAR